MKRGEQSQYSRVAEQGRAEIDNHLLNQAKVQTTTDAINPTRGFEDDIFKKREKKFFNLLNFLINGWSSILITLLFTLGGNKSQKIGYSYF